MAIIKILIFVISVIKISSAQVVQIGQCNPNIALQDNFDLDSFTGRWYGQARTDSPVVSGDCSSLTLTVSNGTINFNIEAIANNFDADVTGTATLEAGTAKFTVNLQGFTDPADFWIMLTDYENYAIGYSCEDISTTQRAVYIWQLSRDLTFTNDMVPAFLNQTMHNLLGITNDDLRQVVQSGVACELLPRIPAGQPVILPGLCNANRTAVQQFDAVRFTGTWYGIASYYSENEFGTCNTAQYSLGANGVDVVNSQVVNEQLLTITGNAIVASTDGSGVLLVTLEVAPNVFAESTLFILDTDYDNYAVSYTCVNVENESRRVNSWILSRTRQLSNVAQNAVDALISSELDLNTEFYQDINRTDADCFYFPEPALDTSVVFPGQCDMSIPAVPSFDVARYLGVWYDLQSYPTTFQNASCDTAEYTLNDGFVDVLNTQVVGQSLDVVRGIAVPVAEDGSGKLSVTFTINNFNVTTDYWILATDYDSYAFVYSCTNLNAFSRQVSSWKLSRTKQLPQAGVTAINNVMAGIQVLDERYFVARDHTEEGCFYFPDPQPGVPVVFPGQCDGTVTVVQNFNLQNFAGTWYEVEAYPKEQQTGQCINHEYTLSGNSLNLVSSSITDQFLGLTNGSLMFTNTTDTSARMTLTLQTTAGDISFPFWILATDYNDYALAYSCVNVNNFFRAVYSWKLSRTQQLSTNANAVINNIVANNIVLDNQYYETIGQSDSACFYLPDLAPGEPVVLIGQCDPNITAISNFDAARYLGTWRLLESYPSDAQNGTCNDATYSLGDGVVNVYNTQVVNQQLNTINGTAVVSSVDGSGKLTVTFPGVPGSMDLFVLDTDYDNFALAYSCVDLTSTTRRVWSWKLSRTRSFSAAATARINQVINGIDVLNNRFYVEVDQSPAACFYYPVPNPAAAVVFRGQCDENIPVVTNFTLLNFMGLWHDIESYPPHRQGGTCNNAEYTLTNGNFSVTNSHVVNERLVSVSGIGILATTDGSAKLIINTPPSDVWTDTVDFWILATDYSTYALAYTCANIDAEYMQVWTWKLSRTKQLTAAAVTAINNVINTIPVLDQRYYVQRDQTVEGCFYFPEPQPGVPVIFPGQCDNTIQAVSNFNMSQFAGVWYEIQTYPIVHQPGQCYNHEYSVTNTANTLSLVTTRVLYQSLDTFNGSVVFAGTDGTGRLSITITVDGEAIVIPFWILSTDYTDYALAYNCANRGTDFRAIYSWKLSRTKQLSAAANATINTAIAGVTVLDNDYYEIVDQSDDGCFYLPEYVPGQVVEFPGQCDENITVVQNFDAARYLGRWRLIESYPSQFQNGACNQATYSLLPNGTVDVFNTQVVNQTLETIVGNAVVVSTDGSAKLEVTFPEAPVPTNYWVLSTDYDSYALVYSCANVAADRRRVWSWKMSRTTSLSAQAVSNIQQVVNSIDVLNNRYYETISQSDSACFYYPTPDEDSSVIFRGQCDESIPVVTNFDAVRYMGTWRDLESYPVEFQNGSCPTATYSLSDAGVDVFNTQVLNQQLDVINGVAVLATNDSSAKLIVSFPIPGTNFTTTSPYWVLATDYDNYALVYSCVNIDDEYRRVASWKLGRSNQLPAAAVTAINNVINTIPVLDNRYYIQRDHSADGCFYFPEPQPGVPVIFPGQCDNTIQAASNFNMNQFAGVWHEIQSYPIVEQPGQCYNHEYSVTSTANTLSLLTSRVLDLSLNTFNGSVVFASTDGSGRLTITITVDGQDVVLPFWILSTDYTDYALAYNCANRGTDFRAIYSWKLSRTKQLSAAANTAINNAIAGVTVLDNDYYEDIDQSDDACFYLPVYVPGQVVEFSGQCDENIPVVQNFDAARYLGRWRLIESYPSDFQNGACNQATYSLLPNGTVDVFNTQVVNQSLETIVGNAVVVGINGSAKLEVTFPNAPQSSNYWVLSTDYDSYALVYSCANIAADRRRVWSWKMSRTTSLSAQAVSNIEQVVNSIDVLNNRYYETISHSDSACFYYPTPDVGSSVIFRGQCDESIPVVTNFDAVRYMGTWRDLESYPVEFQNGSCPTATYSLSDAGVDVFNTQVLNQQLDVINGVAVLATNDSSAKLIVTFPIAGTNFTISTPYWVLATDYDNYALVYSCTNINDEYRRVSSWKLGRSNQLPAAAVTAINNVINTIPVLDNRYYIQRDHSADGCFYFPEPQPGVPVIFPGQCDNTIQAVSNFNMNQFAGVWHEIQSYPIVEQPGQCYNHEYSVTSTANTLSLLTSRVLDLSLNTFNGSVVFASTDGSGRLTITITVDGQDIVVPFWILNTDYTDYALAYNCVNRGSDFRVVYSWKLSRTKQLSAAANTAISNAIAGVTVLDNIYYEDVDQSDNGCFYLPEFVPGEVVDFPGQCDENIPVVQNFDAARYLGRWRMIESYPSQFQSGACNQATYSLLENGTVNVFNTQVVNQTLENITGIAVVVSTDGSAKLDVYFPNTSEPAKYWVLSTDYDSYALVYSCANIAANRRRVWSWKLSRNTTLSAEAVNVTDQIVNSIDVLDNRYYETISHSDRDCFYYPPVDRDSSVFFRGRCDESIPVVSNFDVARYLGTWRDIEGYPVQFQNGTCPTATYSLSDAGVDVFNTQVLNQQLDVINGVAVLATNDSSAKLIVSFPIAGTNFTTSTPYWVLATDYDNFALVYSCVNIDDEYRRVSSWKLSRQTTLSAASITAINNVVNTIDVLDERYYGSRGHSEEDCFFYPDNDGGPVILDGQCDADDQVPVVTSFNTQAFAGTWHEVSRFPSELQSGTCASTQLTLSGQNTFNVVQNIVTNERMNVLSGTASVPADGRGVISTVFSSSGASTTNIFILDTDYSDFALAYSCRNIGNNTKQVYSWKFSRSQDGLSAAANDRIDAVVSNKTDLFEGYYEDTDQGNTGCFYYPVFDQLPPSIVLPGPCNATIQGKSNFDAAGYLGRWFEIASYPQLFQFGDCARAEYTLSSGVVDVVNTQVVNNTLDTMVGVAVPDPNGTGYLNVTFVLDNGVVNVADYFVLETDYTNFALVYSCTNLPNNQRNVFSWKLSRTRTLSNASESIINSVISNTQGLLEEYYAPTSQTEDACFYIPEFNPNRAPVFRGQCRDITGVQNFDMQRYLGWWHEIERYPTDTAAGDCISAQFGASGNQFQVVNTNVFDLSATITTGTVTASTNGRLTKTLSNGQVVEMWVLATDYSSYSLLYSCENINDEYMRVWSAKHSKARSLTQAAQSAMDSVIENNAVLVSTFYLPVDQTDGACFHYPDQTDYQIILPGQCDLSIPAVMAFDPVQYTGTWYQIERYPQIHELGSCTGARYTLDEETGVVTLLNWEVVDGELDTIEGTAVISSTDGSARLTVELPIRGTNETTTTPLYVLATDYVTYSLAYSCVNVNEFQRAVGAWKLSRHRTMPEAGVTAINNVMATRDELHQEYFITVSQSEECEEPSAGVLIKSSIIVMLICAVIQMVVQ